MSAIAVKMNRKRGAILRPWAPPSSPGLQARSRSTTRRCSMGVPRPSAASRPPQSQRATSGGTSAAARA